MDDFDGFRCLLTYDPNINHMLIKYKIVIEKHQWQYYGRSKWLLVTWNKSKNNVYSNEHNAEPFS